MVSHSRLKMRYQKNLKKKANLGSPLFQYLAERTGLEPATPGVTGRYSNQLNYRSKLVYFATTEYSTDKAGDSWRSGRGSPTFRRPRNRLQAIPFEPNPCCPQGQHFYS
jgi:hypothetical protein